MNQSPRFGRALTIGTALCVLILLALSSTLTALAAPMPVNVTFQVTVPAFTLYSNAVQIVGDRGASGEPFDPLTEWGAGVNLTQISPTLWEVTLNFNEGDELSFNFRRDGDNDLEESEADGYTSVLRSYTVPMTGGAPVVLPLTVANWEDLLLVSISPFDGETDVAIDTNIVATFNKTIDSSSTFVVSDSGTIAGAFTVAGDTLTFDPTSDLVYNETYYVNIAGDVTGTGVTSREFYNITSFSTPAAPDVPVTFNVTTPWYELSVPNVYVTGNAAQLGNNDPDFFQLSGDPFGGYSGTVMLQEGSTLTYYYTRGSEATRETGVDNATFYTRTITVSDGLVVNDSVSFWEDPLVMWNSPQSGTLYHPINQPLTVSFSKNVNFGQNLVVKDPSNNTVAGVSSYDAGTFTYIFTPSAPFAYNTNYTLSVANFVATDGAVQQYPLNVSFKTTPAPIEVTFTVTVPTFTPVGSVIYFNYEYSFADVNGAFSVAGSEAMTPTGVPYQYSYTLEVLETTDVFYYIHRGSVDTEETEADGETSVMSVVTVDEDSGGMQAVAHTVANWRDPILVSHTPANGATQQSVNSSVELVFSKPIGVGTFTIVNSDNAAVAGSISLVGGSNVITFTPDAPGFRHADTITVTAADFPGFGTGMQQSPATFTFETEALELLTNGGFEADRVTFKPDPWKLRNASNEKVKCNDVVPRFSVTYEGLCAFMFRSSNNENSYLSQVLTAANQLADVPFAVGDELILSAYFSTPNAANLRMQLRVTYSDGTFDSVFVPITTQAAYRKITAPVITLTRTDITQIRVQLRNMTKGGRKNRAWIDNVSLKLRQGDVVVRGLPTTVEPLALPDSFRGGN